MPIFVNNKAFRIVIWYSSGRCLVNMMLKRIYITVVLFAEQTDKQCKTGKPQSSICLSVNGEGVGRRNPSTLQISFCNSCSSWEVQDYCLLNSLGGISHPKYNVAFFNEHSLTPQESQNMLCTSLKKVFWIMGFEKAFIFSVKRKLKNLGTASPVT